MKDCEVETVSMSRHGNRSNVLTDVKDIDDDRLSRDRQQTDVTRLSESNSL